MFIKRSIIGFIKERGGDFLIASLKKINHVHK
jgi:hypothetical protein